MALTDEQEREFRKQIDELQSAVAGLRETLEGIRERIDAALAAIFRPHR